MELSNWLRETRVRNSASRDVFVIDFGWAEPENRLQNRNVKSENQEIKSGIRERVIRVANMAV